MKRNWTPSFPQMCIFRHPIVKSWLKPCFSPFSSLLPLLKTPSFIFILTFSFLLFILHLLHILLLFFLFLSLFFNKNTASPLSWWWRNIHRKIWRKTVWKSWFLISKVKIKPFSSSLSMCGQSREPHLLNCCCCFLLVCVVLLLLLPCPPPLLVLSPLFPLLRYLVSFHCD